MICNFLEPSCYETTSDIHKVNYHLERGLYMDILEVRLDWIVWDLESRVHLDIESMKKNIQLLGLLTPLYVVELSPRGQVHRLVV